MLGAHGELPRVFTRTAWGRAVPSLAVIAVLALLAVNLVDLHALSAATSGGFLLVYAMVNLANVKLARETGSQKWISALAAILCIAALAIMVFQFAQAPATRSSAYAVVAVVVLALVVELVFRWLRGDLAPPPVVSGR